MNSLLQLFGNPARSFYHFSDGHKNKLFTCSLLLAALSKHSKQPHKNHSSFSKSTGKTIQKGLVEVSSELCHFNIKSSTKRPIPLHHILHFLPAKSCRNNTENDLHLFPLMFLQLQRLNNFQYHQKWTKTNAASTASNPKSQTSTDPPLVIPPQQPVNSLQNTTIKKNKKNSFNFSHFFWQQII